ncbi:MAG: hypothetical protein WC516_08610 [Patescibacteria group bacterium]|jgi:fatty acid desaturase
MKLLNHSFGWKTLLAVLLLFLAFIVITIFMVITSGWQTALCVYGIMIIILAFSSLVAWLITTDDKR